MNVLDEYKGLTVEQIKEKITENVANFSVLVENLKGGLNLGIILRTANAFGAKQVYYYGEKHWDRRSSVGTQNYTNLIRLKTVEEVKAIKEQHTVTLCVDNIEGAVVYSTYIQSFLEERERRSGDYNKGRGYSLVVEDYLLIFGEEGSGISKELLELADKTIYIKQYGSVRSLNVSSAAAIVMNGFRELYEIIKND
jgi:tRNA G18 (ribose-2'-O)-methylase SpoU